MTSTTGKQHEGRSNGVVVRAPLDTHIWLWLVAGDTRLPESRSRSHTAIRPILAATAIGYGLTFVTVDERLAEDERLDTLSS